jgi:hypothetical protein
MTLNEIIAKVVPLIPSRALGSYLSEHFPDWSVMQTATIIIQHCEKETAPALIEQLIGVAKDEADRKLLRSALNDLREFGYIDKETNRIYRERFSGEVFPLFPFLEKCYLPVLFGIGDVISFQNYDHETKFACIEDLSDLSDEDDYTGECYYCHDLDCPDPVKAYYDGSAHLHVPSCKADAADEHNLTPRLKANLDMFRVCIGNRM